MVSPHYTTAVNASENSSEERGKMVHSRSVAPSQKKEQQKEQRSPPKTHKKKKEQKARMQKEPAPPPKTNDQEKEQQKEQPPPPTPTSYAPIFNKTAAIGTPAKRPREEENIPELPATNMKKKKAKKQIAEVVSTPSLPQTSAKKAPQVWSAEDELAFLNGLLDFTKGNKEDFKNMNPAYDHVRKTTGIECTNKQFRDKFSRLRSKFLLRKGNMGGNHTGRKRTNQVAMYKLCKKLWGGQDEGNDEHPRNLETVGKPSLIGKEKKTKKKEPIEAEEDGEKIKDGEDQQEGQDEPKRSQAMANAMVNYTAGDAERITGECSAGDAEWINGELYSRMCEEWDNILNEMKNNVAQELEESQAKKRARTEGHFMNTRTGIHSGRWAPMLSKEQVEAHLEKWHSQQIMEMKTILGRLKLLQEEREMYLEGLGKPECSGRS